MTKRYKPYAYTAVLGAVLFAASMAAAQMPKGKGDALPVSVLVAQVSGGLISDRSEALGTLKGNESVPITATVTDTVSKIFFEDGQRVLKGDVLLEMADGEEGALLQEARVIAEESRKQLERIEELAGQGAVSQSQLDTRRRDYKTARARLDSIASKMKDRVILAPFDGVVGLRNISVGALIQPGTRITTLEDDSVMKLDFTVPSIFMSDLVVGQKIEASAREYKNQVFEGTISAIDNSIDPVTRSITVRAIVANPKGILKSGLLMNVVVIKNERQALLVPEEAITQQGEKAFVFVADQSKTPAVALQREVKIGARLKGQVEILDGVALGTPVVIHGGMMVRDGAAISVKATQQKGQPIAELISRQNNATDKGATRP